MCGQHAGMMARDAMAEVPPTRYTGSSRTGMTSRTGGGFIHPIHPIHSFSFIHSFTHQQHPLSAFLIPPPRPLTRQKATHMPPIYAMPAAFSPKLPSASPRHITSHRPSPVTVAVPPPTPAPLLLSILFPPQPLLHGFPTAPSPRNYEFCGGY